ncbi:signal recognition particle 9 kDa protein-like [Corticium candelabrum]|uniref:signal recognition particle 9 kDa protein-like n=1 Tax=Corticium candelabrum TaxID=121492 RepID=UPI002E25B46B|nr:signal recognition particle 9 kDa protein-like [Corticium candelabrum]
MPYIPSWDEFVRAAEEIYQANPYKARYVVKYRHCQSKLELKVTDDIQCVKYRTDQAQDIKRLEKLNNSLMRMMVSKPSEIKQ